MSYMKQFQLASYNHALATARVININELSTHIWLQIPPHVSAYLELSRVEDMGTTPPTSIDWSEEISREGRNRWLKVNIAILSVDIGLHMYKFVFANMLTGEDEDYYFVYQIQSDAPDQPYIYMTRKDAE